MIAATTYGWTMATVAAWVWLGVAAGLLHGVVLTVLYHRVTATVDDQQRLERAAVLWSLEPGPATAFQIANQCGLKHQRIHSVLHLMEYDRLIRSVQVYDENLDARGGRPRTVYALVGERAD